MWCRQVAGNLPVIPGSLPATAGSCPRSPATCRGSPAACRRSPAACRSLPERCLPPAGLVFALVKTADFLIEFDATTPATEVREKLAHLPPWRQAALRELLEAARAGSLVHATHEVVRPSLSATCISGVFDKWCKGLNIKVGTWFEPICTRVVRTKSSHLKLRTHCSQFQVATCSLTPHRRFGAYPTYAFWCQSTLVRISTTNVNSHQNAYVG